MENPAFVSLSWSLIQGVCIMDLLRCLMSMLVTGSHLQAQVARVLPAISDSNSADNLKASPMPLLQPQFKLPIANAETPMISNLAFYEPCQDKSADPLGVFRLCYGLVMMSVQGGSTEAF